MISAIPEHSLVLVTGVNSYLGSHVADQFLLAGYRIRGTARHESKIHRLKERWDKLYPGKFEFSLVPDMAMRGAFDEAVKGEYHFLES
jgi:nucleoside-diphosphate-sugar epimerase